MSTDTATASPAGSSGPSARRRPISVVVPSLKDPRIMLSLALTTWTVLGQTAYYFNRDFQQLGAAIGTACIVDFILALIVLRQIALPLSAYITGLSIGLLLESYDWRVFVLASMWGILSKYLLNDGKRHFFNPSNFAVVAAIVLLHDRASVAPGSQWGADYRIAVLIMCIGMMMMYRVNRLDLALAWLSGFAVMGLFRMAAGKGGLVFALGPMLGAEFALFTFSMMPDPKASPPTRRGRILWGFSIAIMDGILRYFDVRYSMFYALFAHTAILPIMHLVATRAGFREKDPWKLLEFRLGRQGVPGESA